MDYSRKKISLEKELNKLDEMALSFSAYLDELDITHVSLQDM